jgi:hypothetical protein
MSDNQVERSHGAVANMLADEHTEYEDSGICEYEDSGICTACKKPFQEYVIGFVCEQSVQHDSPHGYCQECRGEWIERPRRRQVHEDERGQTRKVKGEHKALHPRWEDSEINGARPDPIKPSYEPSQETLMGIVLNGQPKNCRGAILCRLLQAKPILIDKGQLVSSIEGFSPNTVRNTLSKLIREGSVREFRGDAGISAPRVMLEELGVSKCRTETTSGGRKTIYCVQIDADLVGNKVPATLDGFLANAEWSVVTYTVACADAEYDGDKAIAAISEGGPRIAELPVDPIDQDKIRSKPRNRNMTAKCLAEIQGRFDRGLPPLSHKALQRMFRCSSRKPPRDAYAILWATEAHQEYFRAHGIAWGNRRGRPANAG